MIASNLRKAYANGSNRHAREHRLYASCLAGMAFSNTQNGLDHALALAIGGRYHLPQGVLTAFICPWVMMAVPEKFVRIAEAFGEDVTGVSEVEGARLAVLAVQDLLGDVGISYKLSTYGVPQEKFPAIARATAAAVRLISNNPRDVTEDNVIRLLEAND